MDAMIDLLGGTSKTLRQPILPEDFDEGILGVIVEEIMDDAKREQDALDKLDSMLKGNG